MKNRTLACLLPLLLLAGPVLAQQTLLQGGPFTAGHLPMYAGQGTTQPVVQDSGTAAGGAAGVNPKELGLTVRSTGTPPYASAGSGPLGANLCDYDGPLTVAGGYHYLCLSPNAQGGGLIAYGAGGAAPQLPLIMNLNGSAYEFPFVLSGGVVGPQPTVVNNAATWNNSSGTLLRDSGVKLVGSTATHNFFVGGGNTTLSGTENTAVGDQSLPAVTSGNYNNAFGFQSMLANTTGFGNTVFGAHAMQENLQGQNNTALGNSALNHNHSDENVAVGLNALYSTVGTPTVSGVESGYENTAVGTYALYLNVSGHSNVAIGHAAASSSLVDSIVAIGASSLQNNTTGTGNTAVGTASLDLNVSGSYNTAVGIQSGFHTTGGTNTYLGGSAGYAVTTGSSNTILGYNAGGTNLATGSGNILIGAGADTPAGNTSNYLNVGNLVTGTLSGSPSVSVAGLLETTYSLKVSGAGADTPGANIAYLDDATGTARITGFGPDNSTPGAFSVVLAAANGSGPINPLSISSGGAATLSGQAILQAGAKFTGGGPAISAAQAAIDYSGGFRISDGGTNPIKIYQGGLGGTLLGQFTSAGLVLGGGLAYAVNSSVGVSCSGSPTSSFASVGGIVTHC